MAVETSEHTQGCLLRLRPFLLGKLYHQHIEVKNVGTGVRQTSGYWLCLIIGVVLGKMPDSQTCFLIGKMKTEAVP